jgi:hypothetical protein
MVGPDHLLISVVWNDRKYDRRGMGRVMIDCIRRRSDFRAVAWSSPVFVSNLPAAAGVPTDNHNQSLFGASGWPAVRLQANVVLQGSTLKNVIPGATFNAGTLISAKCSGTDQRFQ